MRPCRTSCRTRCQGSSAAPYLALPRPCRGTAGRAVAAVRRAQPRLCPSQPTPSTLRVGRILGQQFLDRVDSRRGGVGRAKIGDFFLELRAAVGMRLHRVLLGSGGRSHSLAVDLAHVGFARIGENFLLDLGQLCIV